MCRVTAHTIMQLIIKNTSLTIAQLSWWGFIRQDKSYVEDWEPHIFKRVFCLIWIRLISYSTVSTSHSRKVKLVKALMWLPPTSLKKNKVSGFIHVLCNSFAGGSLSSGLVFYYSVFPLSIYSKNSLNLSPSFEYECKYQIKRIIPFSLVLFCLYLWLDSPIISAIIGWCIDISDVQSVYRNK